MPNPSAPSWPALSLAEAERRLCAPGAPFEMETVEVDGVRLRSWKRQPATLADLARRARAMHGSRTFLVLGSERVDFESWFRATAAMARHLAGLGVLSGDRVAIAMRNLPEWPVAFFAAAALGAVVAPLNAWGAGEELAHGVEDSGAAVLICDGERWRRIAPLRVGLMGLRHVIVARAQDVTLREAERLEDVIGRPADYGAMADGDLPGKGVRPDDPATLFYTSGTTGRPRAALGSHRNILCGTVAAAFVAARSALRRGEAAPPSRPRTTLLAIPLFHVTACCSTLMGALQSGSTLVLMHRWDARRALELIEEERVEVAGGVPFVAAELVAHPDRDRFNLSSLRQVSYGGAPAPPELARRIAEELGAAPGNGWGMTETSATVTNHVGEDYLHRPLSCGPPLPVNDLRIMDGAGETVLATGEIGELWVRGPQVVARYWRDPEPDDVGFKDGWRRTGDLARLDEEGFCYIVDRLKDVIIRGGENIHAAEVEARLHLHPAVLEAAVVGLPHPSLGETPAAAVRLLPGRAATEEELKAWTRAGLAGFKTPVLLRLHDRPLPRNAAGKIVKSKVRAMLQAPPTPVG